MPVCAWHRRDPVIITIFNIKMKYNATIQDALLPDQMGAIAVGHSIHEPTVYDVIGCYETSIYLIMRHLYRMLVECLIRGRCTAMLKSWKLHLHSYQNLTRVITNHLSWFIDNVVLKTYLSMYLVWQRRVFLSLSMKFNMNSLCLKCNCLFLHMTYTSRNAILCSHGRPCFIAEINTIYVKIIRNYDNFNMKTWSSTQMGFCIFASAS